MATAARGGKAHLHSRLHVFYGPLLVGQALDREGFHQLIATLPREEVVVYQYWPGINYESVLDRLVFPTRFLDGHLNLLEASTIANEVKATLLLLGLTLPVER